MNQVLNSLITFECTMLTLSFQTDDSTTKEILNWMEESKKKGDGPPELNRSKSGRQLKRGSSKRAIKNINNHKAASMSFY